MTCKKNDEELHEAILGYWYELSDLSLISDACEEYFFERDSVSIGDGIAGCDENTYYMSKNRYFIIDRYLYIQNFTGKIDVFKIKFLRDSEAEIFSQKIYRKKLKLECFDGTKKILLKCDSK